MLFHTFHEKQTVRVDRPLRETVHKPKVKAKPAVTARPRGDPDATIPGTGSAKVKAKPPKAKAKAKAKASEPAPLPPGQKTLKDHMKKGPAEWLGPSAGDHEGGHPPEVVGEPEPRVGDEEPIVIASDEENVGIRVVPRDEPVGSSSGEHIESIVDNINQRASDTLLDSPEAPALQIRLPGVLPPDTMTITEAMVFC